MIEEYTNACVRARNSETHVCKWESDLPYPPSVNHYYRHVGYKVLISADGRKYRQTIERLVRGSGCISGNVSLRVDAYPPDGRRRDLDNLLKSLQDAIVHGGILSDDSNIKKLTMEMHEPQRPLGIVHVTISQISQEDAEGSTCHTHAHADARACDRLTIIGR